MHARRRAAAAIAATGLAAALLPLAAGSAEADPTGPSFAYLTITSIPGPDHDASSERLWASSPGSFATRTLLAPDVYVHAYDVSEDGNEFAVAGQSDKLTLPALNVSRGLLLTVRDPVTSAAVTRSIATYVSSNPDLTPDGSMLFWMDGKVLYRYDVATRVTTAMTSRFAPLAGEYVDRLAVSPDGTRAAVLYRTDYEGQKIAQRLKAATLAPGGTVYQEQQSLGDYQPFVWPGILAWTPDSTRVIFSRADIWQATGRTTWSTTLAGPPVAETAMNESFDLSVVDGTWYRFRWPPYDGYEAGSSPARDVAPSDWTTYPTGVEMKDFRGSAVQAPAVVRAVDRAPSTSRLYLAKSDVFTGEPVTYASLATYLVDPTGTHPYATDAAQIRVGTLLASRDGKTFTKLRTTAAGVRLWKWPGGELFGNGQLTSEQTKQNLWLRWCFGGDVFVSGGCTATKKITAHPYIDPTADFSSTGVRLRGSVTRTGGTVVLSKLVGGTYRYVASAPVNSQRRFTFGYRSLTSGTYQISIKADAKYGLGIVRFQLTV